MYVLIGSQFEYITVLHLEIQPDPVSQTSFSVTYILCRFSKNLESGWLPASDLGHVLKIKILLG